jgi:hypothetical protein
MRDCRIHPSVELRQQHQDRGHQQVHQRTVSSDP